MQSIAEKLKQFKSNSKDVKFSEYRELAIKAAEAGVSLNRLAISKLSY